VKQSLERTDEELAFLMAHDGDPFNRWDAGQQLALRSILQQIDTCRAGGELEVPEQYMAAFRQVLLDTHEDPAFVSQAVSLPLENWIGEQMAVIDPDAIFQVLRYFRRSLGEALRSELLDVYERNFLTGVYRYNAEDSGRRTLKNTCLGYLLAPDQEDRVVPDMLAIALTQYRESNNMTDRMAALKSLVNGDREKGDQLLVAFYEEWQEDPQVVDKWLSLQALCPLHGTLERVRELTRHPAFTVKNPNKVRALIGSFCSGNMTAFHAADGTGYHFLSDFVLRLDPMNPQIAARLLAPLTIWRRYDENRRTLMRHELERIMDKKDLSGDVAEVAGKSLQGSDE
jgi:aminopeptidase N